MDQLEQLCRECGRQLAEHCRNVLHDGSDRLVEEEPGRLGYRLVNYQVTLLITGWNSHRQRDPRRSPGTEIERSKAAGTSNELA